MSTYYRFVCKEHNVSGGFLSRQAWGTGNFDIIETFKFLGLHKDCHPTLYSEHQDDYDIPDISSSKESMMKFIEEARGIMPHSNDWKLVKDTPWEKVENEWEKKSLEGWFPEN